MLVSIVDCAMRAATFLVLLCCTVEWLAGTTPALFSVAQIRTVLLMRLIGHTKLLVHNLLATNSNSGISKNVNASCGSQRNLQQ